MAAEDTEGNEQCQHNDRDQRPVCTTDGGIELFCPNCYMDAKNAGRLDFDRDAEVFGYAN